MLVYKLRNCDSMTLTDKVKCQNGAYSSNRILVFFTMHIKPKKKVWHSHRFEAAIDLKDNDSTGRTEHKGEHISIPKLLFR